jgi:hypothetical protein
MVWSAIANVGKTLLTGLKSGGGILKAGATGGQAAYKTGGLKSILQGFRSSAGTAFRALTPAQKQALIRTGYATGGLAVGKGLSGS